MNAKETCCVDTRTAPRHSGATVHVVLRLRRATSAPRIDAASVAYLGSCALFLRATAQSLLHAGPDNRRWALRLTVQREAVCPELPSVRRSRGCARPPRQGCDVTTRRNPPGWSLYRIGRRVCSHLRAERLRHALLDHGWRACALAFPGEVARTLRVATPAGCLLRATDAPGHRGVSPQIFVCISLCCAVYYTISLLGVSPVYVSPVWGCFVVCVGKNRLGQIKSLRCTTDSFSCRQATSRRHVDAHYDCAPRSGRAARLPAPHRVLEGAVRASALAGTRRYSQHAALY